MNKLNYQKLTLSNKLTLIIQPISWKKSLSVYAYIGAGPRYETKKTAGLAHFLEHMLFEGTNKFPSSKKLASYIESVGGIAGAWTEKEYVLYYLKVPKEYSLVALNYLSELLFNSILKEDAINKEKKIILEELRRKKDNPEIDIWDLWMEWVWGTNQWLGRSTLGNETTIKNTTRTQLLKYLNNLYTQENMVISVTGNFKRNQIISYFNNFFGKAKERIHVSFKKPVLKQEKMQVKIVPSELQQNQLILGFFTGVSYGHPDSFALTILADILTKGVNSRLFHKLVYDLGIAYSVRAGNWFFSNTGLFYVQGGFSTINIKKALGIVAIELDKLKKIKVNIKELTETKIKEKSDLIFALEDPEALASFYAHQQIVEKRITSVNQIFKKIDMVTVEDIQKVAQKYFNSKYLSLLIKGPIDISFKNMSKKILSRIFYNIGQ